LPFFSIQLDDEGLKEKKKQKLMKAGFDARIRARREKAREKEEREAEEEKEVKERERDLLGWVDKTRKEQEVCQLAYIVLLDLRRHIIKVLIGRIKDRARRKAELSDRRSAASQARMKSIANLASDDRVSKKKRKGGTGKRSLPNLPQSF
jgi:actin-related protein 5